MANINTEGRRLIPKVLYFIAGMVPTEAETKDAQRFGIAVGMRNAMQVSDIAMSALEECDAVAGLVPERYAKNFPNINDMDLGERMLRMSDLDRPHGPIHSTDNELARAAKPPSVNQDRASATGALRPVGAMTLAGGGWVAPQPGNPDGVASHGSERAENGPQTGPGEGGQGAHINPQRLSDAGAVLPASDAVRDTATGPVAEGGGVGGFKPPEPVAEKPLGTPTFPDEH